MTRPDTDPLLAELAAGRAEAFEALYDRFGRRLYWAAWGMLGSPEEAEDAVQEVFVSVVRSRERLAEVNPRTLGQAARISGINPSDILALHVSLVGQRRSA